MRRGNLTPSLGFMVSDKATQFSPTALLRGLAFWVVWRRKGKSTRTEAVAGVSPVLNLVRFPVMTSAQHQPASRCLSPLCNGLGEFLVEVWRLCGGLGHHFEGSSRLVADSTSV